MAREVRHDATGPLKVDEDDFDDEKGNIAICMCGLSSDYPFCDGTHRTTRDEEAGTVYRYEDGERREIEEIVYKDGGE
ncbi:MULTISPECIES: CDGSH iron-sulfur domain-containing protein [unclassified Haladaptatus]|uniref:CDGSH iron-sulfur domain-containing protein n=1 Tax=unclassified Haladaptatus TaxID=2622732 RepID=UPI00209BF1B5|nr:MULTISPECIES: CDGSH iron-sulfur domain-containing protein [unclassified Haladaptatus]MCO8246289.1 CDGSH iron-sulfur domain-containing protein [Haladaptatus sp. AB643]MCO8255191.1 CDGSH iron-sulfur domain-containing protein [Haladaptatus sp. AB618]